MIVSDVITLLSEKQAQRGVHDAPEYAERQVYCTVRSVGRNEFYQALALGIQTEIRFILDQSFEYQGERRLLYHDQPYEIIRTYVNEADGIELTARKAVDE